MGGKKTDLPPRSSIILTNKSVFDISSSFLVNDGSCRANGINHRLTSLSFSLPDRFIGLLCQSYFRSTNFWPVSLPATTDDMLAI